MRSRTPSHLLTGSFDLAFVIVYLYPLMLLALSYNILSGEQEQGTLALTAASSARLTTVLAGKLMVRAGGPIVAAVAGTLVFMLVVGTRLDTASGLPALGLLTLTIVALRFFLAGAGAAVNSLEARLGVQRRGTGHGLGVVVARSPGRDQRHGSGLVSATSSCRDGFGGAQRSDRRRA